MKKKNNKKNSLIWLCTVALIAVGLLVFCQFYFDDNQEKLSPQNLQSESESTILRDPQTEKEKLKNNFERRRENANITLKAGEQSWVINQENISLSPDLDDRIDGLLCLNDTITANQLPAEEVYCGIDQIVSTIASQAGCDEGSITFSPDSEKMFSYNEISRKQIDKNQLKQQILQALSLDSPTEIEVPFMEIPAPSVVEDFIGKIVLRGKFSTDLSRSNADRKQNVALALSKFNGMIVQPEQEVSFNQTTGKRCQENGYKTAKIIIDGEYVPGVGGGVCQASTTLYNALLLSDIEVLKSCHHTLPASYVPLSFDAMVSEGYADLVFKNTLDTPIFIKAYTTTSSAVVEIYGISLPAGKEIRTRTELIKIIPHSGDDIIEDKLGQYENHVLYKGEYFRLKYPQEGYETKGYVQYFQDGVLQEEKLVRHDRYLPQNGVIVEGSFSLEEGMTLPANKVRYIPPQKLNEKSLDNAKRKLGLV